MLSGESLGYLLNCIEAENCEGRIFASVGLSRAEAGFSDSAMTVTILWTTELSYNSQSIEMRV